MPSNHSIQQFRPSDWTSSPSNPRSAAANFISLFDSLANWLCGMKRSLIPVFAFLMLLTLSLPVPASAETEFIQWSFEEGAVFDYRLISDGGLVEDEIISIRVDSPLPETFELPGDATRLDELDDWMQIPTVPVTAFIPFGGGSPTEVEGFDSIFAYGGLDASYWCRFAVPTGEQMTTYYSLVEGWSSGPHGAIAPEIIEAHPVQANLYWGLKYGFEFSGSIYNVTAWYYEANGDHYLANVTIVAHDSITTEQTHYMSLFTDWRVPLLGSSDDNINFTVGTTGEEILWNTHDVEFPYFYDIYRNGSLVESGVIDLGEGGYVSGWIHFSLDDLEVGVWNFTIVLTDMLMNSVSDTVIVVVYSAMIIAPELLLVVGGIGVIAIVAIVVKRR